MLKRSNNYQHLIQYKQAQAVLRRIIRTAKREYWHRFCGNIGRITPVVWGIIKRMCGVRRDWDLPVLKSGEIVAVRATEKAAMLAQAFVTVHSSKNLPDAGSRGREGAAENLRGLWIRKRGRGIH